MCLVARRLEAAGIATVIVGSAFDVVEACGAPRFVYSDFPLGSACGRPFDRDSQRATVELALGLFESARGPTTLRSPLRWSEGPGWKRDYASLEGLDAAAKARLRESFEREKRRSREDRDG